MSMSFDRGTKLMVQGRGGWHLNTQPATGRLVAESMSQAHALTFSCFRGQPFLSKDRSRGWMIEGIQRACEKQAFDLWAYVIMPEHVPLLVYPREREYSMSLFLKSLKQSVAKNALNYVQEQAPDFLSRMKDQQPNGEVHYRFWQRGGGYDRNLTKPTTVWAQVDDIHANPVRRGLCERPEDWPWSSAAEWQEPGSGLLKMDQESFPRSPRG